MDRITYRNLPPLDDQPGPAPYISEREAARIVDKALATHKRRFAVTPWPRRLATGAMLPLAFAGAVASAGFVVKTWRGLSGAQSTATNDAAPSARPIQPPVHRGGSPAMPGGDDALSDSGLQSQPQSAVVPGGRTLRRAPKRPPVASRATPADLLRTANALRAQSRWRDAERIYRQVAALSPGSDDAYAAMVAAAALRLDHLRDPEGALPLYRGALRSRSEGALAEEARWGVAEAYQVLGNATMEANALREFIAEHPRSLTRPKAEARLRILSGTGGSRAGGASP